MHIDTQKNGRWRIRVHSYRMDPLVSPSPRKGIANSNVAFMTVYCLKKHAWDRGGVLRMAHKTNESPF